jgi:hypothetical protein
LAGATEGARACDDDLDRLFRAVHIAVLFVLRIRVEPVGLTRLPHHLLHRLAVLADDVERAALERDDGAAEVVAMQRQRLVRHDDRLPNPDVGILELGLTPGG